MAGLLTYRVFDPGSRFSRYFGEFALFLYLLSFFIGEEGFFIGEGRYFAARTSISTRTCLGSSRTATALRAGKGAVKASA